MPQWPGSRLSHGAHHAPPDLTQTRHNGASAPAAPRDGPHAPCGPGPTLRTDPSAATAPLREPDGPHALRGPGRASPKPHAAHQEPHVPDGALETLADGVIDAVLHGHAPPEFHYDSDDDADAPAGQIPTAAALDRLFGGTPPNPAAVAGLHARYPRFAAHNVRQFADIVRLSDAYAPRRAIPLASASAAEHFATHARLDKARIADDLAAAQSMGMAQFLQLKAAALAHLTIQHVAPLGEDPRPDLPSMPPRPPAHTLHTFHRLPFGTSVIVPDTFVPNGCPQPPLDDAGYELAKERIHKEDYDNGRSTILPLADAKQLFADAGMTLSSVPHFITHAVGKDKGRLVVDVSRAGLNAPAKKQLLTDIYGPIVYPRTTHFCRLYCAVRKQFPTDDLVMYKADYEGWFKRILLDHTQAGLLAMVFHIDGEPHVVIPHVGQFGCQEFNYAATQASAFIYAKVRAHQLTVYGNVFQHVYSDDNVGCAPRHLHPEIDSWTTANAATHAGRNAQPDTKKEHGTQLTALGALYDIRDPALPTVGLSEALLLKLVRVLFIEFALDLSLAGHTHVRLRLLQRLGSYLTIAADFLPALRPFTAGVYANTRGTSNPRATVRLTHRTVGDIAGARALVYGIILKPGWLRVPMWVPPLTRRLPDQDQDAFEAAQQTAAHAVITTDARGVDDTDTWGGGAFIATPTNPCAAWLQHVLPPFHSFIRSGALSPQERDNMDQINLYEAIEAVLAVDHLLNNWATIVGTDRPSHPHVHVRCDNTSAIAWLTKYKHRHPLIAYVLLVWAQLQCRFNATITFAHLAGKLNVIADAISRDFKVPDGDAIRRALPGLPHTALPGWFTGIDRFADDQRAHPADVARHVLAHFI